jgi:hypothetical protein
MNDPIRYGQMQSEKIADENTVCRQIVKEISAFGITQRQVLMVIYLLGIELEDNTQMRSITGLIRELGGSELFLIDNVENGDKNG